MCARFTLRKEKVRDLAEELDAELSPEDEPLYRPRYNVAPTDLAWIVDLSGGARVLRPAKWSYVVGGGARRLVNVRGEQVGSGAGFREAFAHRRCVVVTDGFYEWPGKGLAPYLLRRADDGLVLLAGLWQRPDPSETHPRFTVLTTRPNGVVAPIHDRMPVVIAPARLDTWLGAEPAAAAQALAPASEDALVATRVSKHVNNVRHDDAECVVAASAP
ncbi:MAG TPA: SOS response-associated peptidase [Polyangia bacterium]|jgi:putative SOS response-associated peptidase YedK|nr:SOS response-associated peptidase [Polyangia bacterium]